MDLVLHSFSKLDPRFASKFSDVMRESRVVSLEKEVAFFLGVEDIYIRMGYSRFEERGKLESSPISLRDSSTSSSSNSDSLDNR
jgi:hypothetical protein